MARSRNIKPDLFKNELLGDADPLLTILFAGLWCLADREGKLLDRPKRIKAEIFPYRDLTDFNGYLTVLQQLGFIDRYSVGEVAIIKVLEFSKHQSPHKTEKASELPDKPRETRVTCSAPLDNESITDEAALIPDSLIPDSLNKTTPEFHPVDDYYVFRGEKFNINKNDFENHRKIYPNLNLVHEYSQLDIELRDTAKKQIWGTLNAKLNYRNKVSQPANQQNGSPRLSTIERNSQANREAYERTQRQIAELEAQGNDAEVVASIQQGAWRGVQ